MPVMENQFKKPKKIGISARVDSSTLAEALILSKKMGISFSLYVDFMLVHANRYYANYLEKHKPKENEKKRS